MNSNEETPQALVVCVRNDGYADSLQLRKLYQVLPDPLANPRHYIRVIDDWGEDYLYPESYFVPVEVSAAVQNDLFQPPERDELLSFTIEYDQEEDGRWIAEVVELPGVQVYGQTREEANVRAQALALRVLADRLEHGEELPQPINISFALAA